MDPKNEENSETANYEQSNLKDDDVQKNLIEDMKKKLRMRIKKTEESPNLPTPEQNKETEIKIFKENFKPALNANEESYKEIPKFYFKLPRQGEVLSQKLREETRAQFLQKKSKELLDNAELKHLWMLLENFNTAGVTPTNEDFFISYPEFKKLKEQAGPKYAPYLTAEVYGRLQRAEGGRVRAVSLFNYAMRCVWLQQTRIGLSLYDVTGQGYLREHDLESYIAELVPSLAALEGLDASFTSFYVCTAARKFLFFLDPLRVGRVRIRDLLACSFLDDLLELREEDLPMEQQEMNWFSGASALRVYGQYLNLDRDHNGMLSIDELAGYGSGTLTRVFLERVFQQCLTYEGEMDYKSYLDFVLALENRREPQAIAYIFRVLDLHGRGYLDSFTLNYFYKGIQDQVAAQCGEPVSFADVQDELHDMVRPASRGRLTLPDLLRCGRAHVALSLLIELHGFMAHEHREALAADA